MRNQREGRGPERASLARSLGRAALLRCPACGRRWPSHRWVELAGACPGCGLRADRGEHDHFLGAMALNLVVAELLTAGSVAAFLVVAWPDPPWGLVTASGVGLAVLLPAVAYPLTKLAWLALDLRFRSEPEPDPPERGGPPP